MPTQEDRDDQEQPKPRRSIWLRLSIGALAGASLGLAYYTFIGCSTGGCPITSNPVTSMLYGSVMGGLITSA